MYIYPEQQAQSDLTFQRKEEMKFLVWATVPLVLGLLAFSSAVALAGGGGFDEFGYDYLARIFVGAADGVDRNLDGRVWGDPTYGNDHLVMKWSKAWDSARFHGAPWTCVFVVKWNWRFWSTKIPWCDQQKIPAMITGNSLDLIWKKSRGGYHSSVC